jgi:undecaprenyl phosphate-alpha-L-ara4N flippase subunit ArnE
MYILKHFPLSMASPMVSLSYVFALIFSVVFLHEAVAWNRWLGVVLIMVGCIFVAK